MIIVDTLQIPNDHKMTWNKSHTVAWSTVITLSYYDIIKNLLYVSNDHKMTWNKKHTVVWSTIVLRSYYYIIIFSLQVPNSRSGLLLYIYIYIEIIKWIMLHYNNRTGLSFLTFPTKICFHTRSLLYIYLCFPFALEDLPHIIVGSIIFPCKSRI